MDEHRAGELLISILTKTRHGAAIPLTDADAAVVELCRKVLGLRPRELNGGHFGPHPNWRTLRKMKEEALRVEVHSSSADAP